MATKTRNSANSPSKTEINGLDVLKKVGEGFLFVLFLLIATIRDFVGIFTRKRKNVHGKTIVITGAAQGLGFEMSKIFALEHGATVCMLDMNQELNEQSARSIRAEGGNVRQFQCDVTKPESLNRIAHELQNNGVEVDIVIANAGILQLGKVEEQPEKNIRTIIDVNVLGVFWTIRAFLPRMKALRRGQIVAMSSVGGHFAETNGSAYCASKFAVRGIMESLENELHDDELYDIKCTTIYPFFTKTTMVSNICQPKSRIQSVLAPRACAESIVDKLLKENVHGFIPASLRPLCTIAKGLMGDKMKFVVRRFADNSFEPFKKSGANSK